MAYTRGMSWATRRRILYAVGVLVFFGVVFGIPIAYKLFTVPPTCGDGIQNQGETTIDRGGPCSLLDTGSLTPTAVLWTRSFKVRDGSYSAVSYIENPNAGAGATSTPYRFRLYDANNVLVADREGVTFIMPAGITPIFEGGIDTGARTVTRAYLDFISPPVWKQMKNTASVIVVGEKKLEQPDTAPRITATAQNTSVAPVFDISFVAVVFDAAGNAFAASSTHIPRLGAGEAAQLVFTWPDTFAAAAARIDITPLVEPVPAAGQ